MTYRSDDFKGDTCPHCGGGDVSKEHNVANIGFLNGAGYFLDFPFGPDYECNSCGSTGRDCFIATTVYGDKDAPEVEALRQFRDKVLMQSAPGRAFVRLYYSGAGKKAAELIKERLPGTIPTIRKGLDWLVEDYLAKNTK